MLKCVFLLTQIFFVLNSFSQISTTSTQKKEIQTIAYDSTKNFLGENVMAYIGQDLYVLPKSESLSSFGYEGFLIDYNKSSFDETNVFQCCQSHNSKYESLVGKYFSVINVIPHPKQKSSSVYKGMFFLKLRMKETGQIVYFNYKHKHSFPFIVVGYFEKTKKEYENKDFVLRGVNWEGSEPILNVSNGVAANIVSGSNWTCSDVTIDDKYGDFSLVLSDSTNQKILFPVDRVNQTKFIFDKKDADDYKKKYGDELWLVILKGEVKVGMTKEMAMLSWGKPKKVNVASYGDQWVYGSKYLYFDENGVLTSWN